MFLELAGEMLGIVETETFGSLRDSGSAHQELLGTLHDEAADMGGGRVARQFTDQVTEIVGRKEQLLGTVFHGGQPQLLLQAFVIVFS